jgi:hypothetical protein
MKPGWKTTEFWLTVGLLALAFVVVIHGGDPLNEKLSLVGAQLAIGVYSHGRARVKSTGAFDLITAIIKLFER